MFSNAHHVADDHTIITSNFFKRLRHDVHTSHVPGAGSFPDVEVNEREPVTPAMSSNVRGML